MIQKCSFYENCNRDDVEFLYKKQGFYVDNNIRDINFAIKFENEVIGCALVVDKKRGIYELINIYILPIFRCLGIGSKFLLFIHEYLRSKKEYFELSVIFNSSYAVERVVRFYKKNRFGVANYDYTSCKLSKDWIKIIKNKQGLDLVNFYFKKMKNFPQEREKKLIIILGIIISLIF